MSGVEQTGSRISCAHENPLTSHCIPDDIPESQLVAIFQKMAKALKQNFPHDINQPAVSIVGVTMRRAFPCPVRASSPLPFCSVYSSRTGSRRQDDSEQ